MPVCPLVPFGARSWVDELTGGAIIEIFACEKPKLAKPIEAKKLKVNFFMF